MTATTEAPTRPYTVPEAADVLGVSKAHVYRLLRDEGHVGGVRAIRIGTAVRLPRRAIDALAAGEVAS